MSKLLIHQINHRFRQTKSIWILYLAFVILFLMNTVTYDKSVDVSMVLYQDQSSLFLIMTVFLLVLQTYKLYVDYKRGIYRWHLLTNKKSAFVLGDVCFMVGSVMVFYVIYYFALRHQINMKLIALDNVKAFEEISRPSIEQVMLATSLTKILIPFTWSGYVYNFLLLVAVVQSCVYSVLCVLKKQNTLCRTLCLLIPILGIYSSFYISQLLADIVYIVLIGYGFIGSARLWKEAIVC